MPWGTPSRRPSWASWGIGSGWPRPSGSRPGPWEPPRPSASGGCVTSPATSSVSRRETRSVRRYDRTTARPTPNCRTVERRNAFGSGDEDDLPELGTLLQQPVGLGALGKWQGPVHHG